MSTSAADANQRLINTIYERNYRSLPERNFVLKPPTPGILDHVIPVRELFSYLQTEQENEKNTLIVGDVYRRFWPEKRSQSLETLSLRIPSPIHPSWTLKSNVPMDRDSESEEENEPVNLGGNVAEWLTSSAIQLVVNMINTRFLALGQHAFVFEMDQTRNAFDEEGSYSVELCREFMIGNPKSERKRHFVRLPETEVASTRMFYGIINLGNVHWIAIEVDIRERCINVFDSLGADVDSRRAKKIALCVHRLMLVYKYPGVGPHEQWTVVRVTNYVQQVNSKDCGVFSCILPYWRMNATGTPREKTLSETDTRFLRLALYAAIRRGSMDPPQESEQNGIEPFEPLILADAE